MIHSLPQSLIETATKHLTHIDVDGELKHKYNSEGKLIHHTDDGIKNFHRWFGNSQSIDAQGRPQVLYHGTDANFDSFNEGAIYLTSSKKHADNYGPVHMKVYAAIKKHVLLDEDGFRSLSWRKTDVTKHQSKGYDGAKQIGKNIWVAFQPHQIKSATGNDGTFSHPTKISESSIQPNDTHIDVDGVMKHRFNSEGNHIHPTEEGIKNFHRWFGDSKVVDGQGRPKVMYHGTQRVEKETKKHDVAINTFKSSANMHWFSDNTSVSDIHAGKLSNYRDGSTIPVYLKASNHFDKTVLPTGKVKNPHGLFMSELIKQAPNKNRTSIAFFRDSSDGIDEKYKSPENEAFISKHHDSPEQTHHYTKLGFDSIKSHMSMDRYYDSPTMGVFHQSQIKSAIGNDGTFDHPNKISESMDDNSSNIFK